MAKAVGQPTHLIVWLVPIRRRWCPGLSQKTRKVGPNIEFGLAFFVILPIDEAETSRTPLPPWRTAQALSLPVLCVCVPKTARTRGPERTSVTPHVVEAGRRCDDRAGKCLSMRGRVVRDGTGQPARGRLVGGRQPHSLEGWPVRRALYLETWDPARCRHASATIHHRRLPIREPHNGIPTNLRRDRGRSLDQETLRRRAADHHDCRTW